MQSSPMDEYRSSRNGSTGSSSEVVVEQAADFGPEIMNVTEMEQSPDGSPNVNATTEENEIANAVDLPVTETEANFPPEYEKFWKTVENNPQDFTGWVYLLQYVEQENHLMAARKAFDKFFIHYPYCYGYWKKYADLEKRHDNIKQSDEVRTSLNKVISVRYCKPNNSKMKSFFGWQYLRFMVKQFYRVFYLHLSLLWHL
uniref:Pre-mRNA processing factor 39 n=2 Tax=Equus TaxID=9789 RepID=A0A9L0TNS6_HORSE